MVTLRQQFSSRSMEWALRLPAGSDDECVLCGVWICGKRHPMSAPLPLRLMGREGDALG